MREPIAFVILADLHAIAMELKATSMRVGSELAAYMLSAGFVTPCPTWVDQTMDPWEARPSGVMNLVCTKPGYIGKVEW